jgi:cytochrome c peroxidase
LFKADVDEPAEPITPIVEFVAVDPSKVKLGERLFSDPRLSRDNTRSCSSCHDISTNGASKNRHDTGLDGTSLQLNTSTVFNASLSFRVGWEGKFRTLESHAVASLKSPQTLGASIPDIVARLDADADLRREFVAAYDHEPDAENVLDALSNFERSLVTPGSRFDRWLAGDAAAMSAEELAGYRSFKKLGCISCHQGENIGGNLFERHGLFHPLASPKPERTIAPALHMPAPANRRKARPRNGSSCRRAPASASSAELCPSSNEHGFARRNACPRVDPGFGRDRPAGSTPE